MSDSATDILFERRGGVGLVTLNRPAQMNALSHAMANALSAQLTAWADDPAVHAVAIQGAGDQAFCAGGDIRDLYEAGRADPSRNFAFFADEYRLNVQIKRFAKPYIAFMDGVTMGGGVGVSVHGRYRVGGDRTLFAMPETGIGLFPDVGGTYFLARTPDRIGLYLGLTGAKANAADCLYAGIVDYYIRSEQRDAVIAALAAADLSADADEVICEILASRAAAPASSDLRARAPEIAALFSAESLPALLAGLDAGSEWAQAQAARIRKKSPFCTAIAFRQLTEHARLSFEDAMRLEYRLARACMTAPDFYEGVRATIIDKDGAPNWSPSALAEVTVESIDAAFASLGAEELAL